VPEAIGTLLQFAVAVTFSAASVVFVALGLYLLATAAACRWPAWPLRMSSYGVASWHGQGWVLIQCPPGCTRHAASTKHRHALLGLALAWLAGLTVVLALNGWLAVAWTLGLRISDALALTAIGALSFSAVTWSYPRLDRRIECERPSGIALRAISAVRWRQALQTAQRAETLFSRAGVRGCFDLENQMRQIVVQRARWIAICPRMLTLFLERRMHLVRIRLRVCEPRLPGWLALQERIEGACIQRIGLGDPLRHRLDLVRRRHARSAGLLLMACGTEFDAELRCIEAELSMLLSLEVGPAASSARRARARP